MDAYELGKAAAGFQYASLPSRSFTPTPGEQRQLTRHTQQQRSDVTGPYGAMGASAGRFSASKPAVPAGGGALNATQQRAQAAAGKQFGSSTAFYDQATGRHGLRPNPQAPPAPAPAPTPTPPAQGLAAGAARVAPAHTGAYQLGQQVAATAPPATPPAPPQATPSAPAAGNLAQQAPPATGLMKVPDPRDQIARMLQAEGRQAGPAEVDQELARQRQGAPPPPPTAVEEGAWRRYQDAKARQAAPSTPPQQAAPSTPLRKVGPLGLMTVDEHGGINPLLGAANAVDLLAPAAVPGNVSATDLYRAAVDPQFRQQYMDYRKRQFTDAEGNVTPSSLYLGGLSQTPGLLGSLVDTYRGVEPPPEIPDYQPTVQWDFPGIHDPWGPEGTFGERMKSFVGMSEWDKAVRKARAARVREAGNASSP